MNRTKQSGKRKPSSEMSCRFDTSRSDLTGRLEVSTSRSLNSGAVGLLDLGDVSADLAELAELDTEELDAVCGDLGLIDGGTESAPECDYDSVSSPGGSTCSGPTYIRHMGFGPDQPGSTAPGRPLSQLSSDSLPSPTQRSSGGSSSNGPPSPLTHSLSQPSIRPKGMLSTRHSRLPVPNGGTHSVAAIRIDEEREDLLLCGGGTKKKKKKIVLRPNLSDNVQDIRGVKVGGCQRQTSVGAGQQHSDQLNTKPAVKQLGTLTSSKSKSKKGMYIMCL